MSNDSSKHPGEALDRGGRDPSAPAGAAQPPQFGDVVSCYFPMDEEPNRPGIKPRPCLVIGSKRSDATGRWYVQLVYGTKQNADHLRPGELGLTDPTSHLTAGLHHPTKFLFRRVRSVPFTFEYFRANHAGNVVLGRLSPLVLRKADQLRVKTFIQAGGRYARFQGPQSASGSEPPAPASATVAEPVER